jgi:predicted Fe-Mo cluster-binding NifX family protein
LKIALSAVSGSLDSQIDPRFGRCQYFIIIDTETMKFDAVQNKSQYAPSGAGIQAAQTVANKGVKYVLTGRVGPNAFNVLSSTGINIISNVFGKVSEAVERFKNGQLKTTVQSSNTPITPGMRGGYGMGRGRGRGIGMGRGRYQSMGRTPITSTPQESPRTVMSKDEEIVVLEKQMKETEEQLNQIKKRLKQLNGSY